MDSAADETLSALLEGKVKFKRNNTTDIRSKAKRVIRRAFEVMVKISGNAKGSCHIKAHIVYISRNGKIEIENERGEILKGKDAIKDVHTEWLQDGGLRRANTRDTANVVLSMQKGTDPKALKNSAREFAKQQFGENYQYVFALHTDTDHPHVHLTVKTLGFDGRRLHIKKGEPQRWRELFAQKLRHYGIDAEATPRAARGVIKKAVSQTLLHIRKKVTPAVDKAKIKEIVEEFKEAKKSGIPEQKPWEKKIKERQTQIRRTWLLAAQELSKGGDPDKILAEDILAFVKSMPPMLTERHEMKMKWAANIQVTQKNENNEQWQDER